MKGNSTTHGNSILDENDSTSSGSQPSRSLPRGQEGLPPWIKSGHNKTPKPSALPSTSEEALRGVTSPPEPDHANPAPQESSSEDFDGTLQGHQEAAFPST